MDDLAKARRAERFAREAVTKGAEPPPRKTMAWSGGKMTSNKDEAIEKFLKRKADNGEALTPSQQTALEAIQRKRAPAEVKSAPPRPSVDDVVSATTTPPPPPPPPAGDGPAASSSGPPAHDAASSAAAPPSPPPSDAPLPGATPGRGVYVPPARRVTATAAAERAGRHAEPLRTLAARARVFVINLARRPDRLAHMERVGADLGLPLTRIEAVDGRAVTGESEGLVDRDWDARPNAAHDRHVDLTNAPHARMTGGEVGCAMSHIRVWQRIAAAAQSDDEPALVFEDDAAPDRHFCARLCEAWETAGLAAPDAFSILYLGWSDRGARAAVPLAGVPPGERGRPCLFAPSYVFMTHAYVIRASAARSLLAQLPVVGPLDFWLSENAWWGLRAVCVGIEGEGYKGEARPLVAQLGRFRRDNDVPRSSRGESDAAAGGRGGRGRRGRRGPGRGPREAPHRCERA